MRVHLMSDLHLEFGKMPRSYKPPECDLVVLAGDIGTGVVGVMWAIDTFTCPVVYVPGNHEFYGKRIYGKHLEKMRAKAAGTNVHVLNNEEIDLGEVVVLGATLWADFDLYGTQPLSQRAAQAGMNDYRQIYRDIREPLTAEDTANFHKHSRYWLSERLRELQADGRKALVVTHFAPSEMSSLPQYRGDPLTPAYASRLENLICDRGPAMWIHGHMHNNVAYTICDTLVLCNPRGYVGHGLNPDFNPSLVVEIGESLG